MTTPSNTRRAGSPLPVEHDTILDVDVTALDNHVRLQVWESAEGAEGTRSVRTADVRMTGEQVAALVNDLVWALRTAAADEAHATAQALSKVRLRLPDELIADLEAQSEALPRLPDPD